MLTPRPEFQIDEDAPIPTSSTTEKQKTKKQEPPKNLVEFVKRYWTYLLPLVILLFLPGGEDVPQRPTRGVAGQAGEAQRVTPGPAPAAIASAKK